MRIINQTKDVVLAEEAVIADTPFGRLKGLLGKRYFPEGQALVLRPCNSIHTFFMRFPIDVIFVDSSYRIIKCCHNLRPWHISGLYLKANFCVEFSAAVLSAKNTQEGDILLMI